MTGCTAERSVQEGLDALLASCEGQEQLQHPLEIQALALTSLIGKALPHTAGHNFEANPSNAGTRRPTGRPHRRSHAADSHHGTAGPQEQPCSLPRRRSPPNRRFACAQAETASELVLADGHIAKAGDTIVVSAVRTEVGPLPTSSHSSSIYPLGYSDACRR